MHLTLALFRAMSVPSIEINSMGEIYMQRERFFKFSDKINEKYKGLSFSCRLWVISTSEHSASTG